MPKKRVTSSNQPTNADAEKFEMLFPILSAVLNEIKELSKKKQDEALNKLKVGMANKILTQVKALLANDPTVQFLDLLDEVTIPTNSDAVLIIAQFKAAMEQYKDKHFGQDENYTRRWFTKENP
jgi:hypothetical protein